MAFLDYIKIDRIKQHNTLTYLLLFISLSHHSYTTLDYITQLPESNIKYI